MSEENSAAPREGSLDAPTRHPIEWRETDFFDEEQLDEELRRVFDICHGCRRFRDEFPCWRGWH